MIYGKENFYEAARKACEAGNKAAAELREAMAKAKGSAAPKCVACGAVEAERDAARSALEDARREIARLTPPLRPTAAYWLSPEGREDAKDTFDDPDDGNAVRPYLDALEKAEADLEKLVAAVDTYRRRCQVLPSEWVRVEDAVKMCAVPNA